MLVVSQEREADEPSFGGSGASSRESAGQVPSERLAAEAFAAEARKLRPLHVTVGQASCLIYRLALCAGKKVPRPAAST